MSFKWKFSTIFATNNQPKHRASSQVETALSGLELQHPKAKHCWDLSLLLRGHSGNGKARPQQLRRVIWGG